MPFEYIYFLSEEPTRSAEAKLRQHKLRLCTPLMEWTIFIVKSGKLTLQLIELDQMLFASPAGADLDYPTMDKVERNHGSLTKLAYASRLKLLLTVWTKELSNHLFRNENIGLDIVTSVKGRKIEGALLFFIFQ